MIAVMAPKQPETVSQQLRQALNEKLGEDGETLYKISKATKIPWNTLKRFSLGDANTFMTARFDKLAEYLGLMLVIDPKLAKRQNRRS